MVNHPNRSRRRYELTVRVAGRHDEISWETPHAQTAHKWFDFTVQHGKTIDTGSPVVFCRLERDGKLVKSAIIGQGSIA